MSQPPPAKGRRLSDVRTKHGFPESFLYYLKKNSSPKLLFKLMHVSKFFRFNEFPFLVVKCLENYGFNDENVTLSNDEIQIYSDKYENVPKPLWITCSFFVEDVADSKLASKLLSNIAYCKLEALSLDNQILNLKEFKIFVGSTNLRFFSFRNSIVKSANGTILSTEEILELLAKLRFFNWTVGDEMASLFSPDTTKAIIDFFDPSVLETFYLSDPPESFDFKLFAKFMNANPQIDFDLHFGRPFSAKYSKMLQEYVDNLILTELYQHRHIYITFEGQTQESHDILYNYYVGEL